jgi:uncharacterized surface protein with fasciclin (FAS1) repeats
MQIKRIFAVAATAVMATTVLTAAPASAETDGTKSLAAVLTEAGTGFDKNGKNYNIVTAAVLAVLEAKPDSAVKVLTDGSVALTAFIPNDNAFRLHVKRLTKKTVNSEAKVFAAVAGLGIPTVEKILLYHVVPGATILSGDALKANNAALKTALGQTFKVMVKGGPAIFLQDKDKAPYPKVILSQVDINKGNAQVAHGINLVLIPKL